MIRWWTVFLMVVPLILQGCSDKPQGNDWLSTYSSKGYVIVKGDPAKGAIVRLFPMAPQAGAKSPVIPTGTVNEDGLFELTSYRTGDGAPEGDYWVTVEWPDPTMNATKGGMPEDPPDRLLGRFSDPRRSKLKAHISPQDNLLEDISLD
ncbi:hypothetical protein [Schlesneria paludicola]|uniref:hypothetical protein n=1 Tax=Schlesneria paludicola TaxID=360056 RepID=UPI00058C7019|nr:hypothetical protein [Schlesneria paludicola]